MKILIIEDEKITRITLTNTLKKEGYEVYNAEDGEEGLKLFLELSPDVIITDLRLPKVDGLKLLSIVLSKSPKTKVILITAFATVETAVEALKLGAYDYLTKPFSPEKLLSILRNIKLLCSVIDENENLKNRLDYFENKIIIGNSDSIKNLIDKINILAPNDYTILIEGESGTGKELVARSLHNSSPRKEKSFIPINCAVIPETLLESELFGHEKGSFSGAIKRHIGFFERANKGTLFIDDIDDFPLSLQVKLLRVLQEREFTRVGGSENIKVDIRIIFATKINLKEKVDQKLFREDLYYRLNIIPIKIPPLRDRKEDIPLLIEHFSRKYNAEDKIKLLSPEIYATLSRYDWPGNIRELENIIKRIIALSSSSKLDSSIIDYFEIPESSFNKADEFENYPPFEDFILQREKEIISWALKKSNNNITQAAKILQIPRTTLCSKIERINTNSTSQNLMNQ